MNLEQVPNTGDHIALPQELIECAAGFSAVNDNPVKKLSGAMAELAGISADVQASINEIQDAFDHEKEQVKEFKAIHSWKSSYTFGSNTVRGIEL